MTEQPKILIGLPVKNCGIYMHNLGEQIMQLDYPKKQISIAIVENDSDDDSWEQCRTLHAKLGKEGYRSVDLMQSAMGFKLSHRSRHRPEVQTERLNKICKVRQFIVDRFLADNDWLLWIDSDYIYIPDDSITLLLKGDAPIVVPVQFLPDGTIYDNTTCHIGTDGRPKKIGELIKENPKQGYFDVDLCNAPFLAAAKVYANASYDRIEPGDQEGPGICRQVRNVGMKCVAAPCVRMIHAFHAANDPT